MPFVKCKDIYELKARSLSGVMALNHSRAPNPRIRRGDFVWIELGYFPPGCLGICIDDAKHASSRVCDVYGVNHEIASLYASQLVKFDVDRTEFKRYLSALFELMEESFGRPLDWEPNDLDHNKYL